MVTSRRQSGDDDHDAVLAEEGDPSASEADREDALDEREARADKHDAARAIRQDRSQGILDAAELRDSEADARDRRAEKRDKDADLKAFLASTDYGDDLPARRSAAMDRLESRADRTSAAADRSDLAEPADDPADDPADNAADDAADNAADDSHSAE